jgi:CheY-like chemotaxis protein
MKDARILIIENEERWQDIASSTLREGLGGELEIDVAESYSVAQRKLRNKDYELISVDLALPDNVLDLEGSTLPEMQLLKEIRQNPRSAHCGVVILSAHPTFARARAALLRYKVYDFIDKFDIDENEERRDEYVEAAKSAIRNALLERAANRDGDGQLLSITFDARGVTGVELVGPGQRLFYPVDRPSPIDFAGLARRADDLNRRLAGGETDDWREEARSIGKALYDSLLEQPEFKEVLRTARVLAGSRRSSLSLLFNGPPEGLSFPFELMTDGSEYLVLEHPVSRQVNGGGLVLRPVPFYKFVESLVNNSEAMRILVVGADSDGAIPAAGEEAASLAEYFKARLDLLGIQHEVVTLAGADATRERVKEELRSGFHLFHYSGHADYDDELPERSPVILRDGILTASDLKLLLSETGLRFMFLSCCLGARNAARAGRGDFHSFPHALSQAGAPINVGHRGVVNDDSARLLAEHC